MFYEGTGKVKIEVGIAVFRANFNLESPEYEPERLNIQALHLFKHVNFMIWNQYWNISLFICSDETIVGTEM